MRFESLQVTGSFQVSGSARIPFGPSSSRTTQTGSLFFDTDNNRLEVNRGNDWYSGSGAGSGGGGGGNIIDNTVDYLVVAGGASGGQLGGGGAGGFRTGSFTSLTSGSTYTITVGAGGAALSGQKGNSGGNSSIAGTGITTITSTGGGGGAGQGATDACAVGVDGGSGGGGGESDNGVNTPGSGTTGQGNDGGAGGNDGGTRLSGGGGGGAGQVGGASRGQSSGGHGGSGSLSSITGTSTRYAGGGGAGAWYYNNGSNSFGGTGGPGGGGNAGTTGNTAATAGEVNTGGGGGGNGFLANGNQIGNSGAGGSGVVILSYDTGSVQGAGGIKGDDGSGRRYHQFNSSDSFVMGAVGDFDIVTGSNLVLHVDAGDFASRGASTWTDLSTYDNDITIQSNGEIVNYWLEGDGSGEAGQFERNGGGTATNVAHTGYGNFTGASATNYTIEFWVRSTATGGNATTGKTILGRNSSDVWAAISIKSNKLAFVHYDSAWLTNSSTTSINDGSWHHCVVTNFSDETGDLWVDGTKELDGSNTALSPNAGTRYLKLDSIFRGYNGENTDGDIAQIRIYDIALTDAQITQNYNATKTNFV